MFTRESTKGLKTGVSYNKRLGKFVSSINKGVGSKHIGVFKTEKEAHLAYCKEKQKHLDGLILKYDDKLPENVKSKLKDWFLNKTLVDQIEVDN